ncbi:MAG: hypothetical protein U5M23_11855 [Marinagarivorans sp.]|nr:hypothetical protein [Marinagarivorans sp.]
MASMDVSTYIIVGLGEALMLSLFGLGAALWYVRKLKSLLAKAQLAKAQKPNAKASLADKDLVVEDPSADVPVGAVATYTDYLDQHIRELRRYHKSLKGGQDIALDLDPLVPIERRMASMRHIMLVAEREATHTTPTNWLELVTRYRQLMRFFEDSPNPPLESQMAELKQALQSSHTKVFELEKYKSLYFDLEKKWHESKAQANSLFDQVNECVGTEQEGELAQLLEGYHGSYTPLAEMFESGQPLPVTLEAATKEIDTLRRMAADQCRMIERLKTLVIESPDSNAKVSVIRGLEKQLAQQQRMTQESETCIQLIESELNGAFKEIQSLKEQIKGVAALRAQVEELKEELAVKVLMIGHLKESSSQPSSADREKEERIAEANLKIQMLTKELARLQQRKAVPKQDGADQ